jgi:Cu/Ag efflux protein CusF
MISRLRICLRAVKTLLALTIAALAMIAVAAEKPSIAQAQPAEPAKVFHGVGVVTAIEPPGSLTINHQPIEGLMPAMEMVFPVNPRALTNGVRPGDEVEFSVEGKAYTIIALKVVGHIK